jgi:hypothetical protein
MDYRDTGRITPDTGRITPVINPGLPVAIRRRLDRKLSHFRSDAGSGVAAFGCLFMIAAPIVLTILHFTNGLSWWWMLTILAPTALTITGAAVGSSDELDSQDRAELIEPKSLDEPARRLLLRAQQAITAVLRSDVYADNLLEHAVREKSLRRHEWEIATALRDISRLRADLEGSTRAGAPGPRTAAVLDSHRQALTLATNATTSRIKALERYAQQLAAADAAKRDWEHAVKVSGRNDEYLDLVARTAADEHAIAEITGLTEQAAAAAQAFQDSLDQADLAAEVLLLPPLRPNA